MIKVSTKTIKFFKNIALYMEPPPLLTLSDWANKYRRLSAEASAEIGQFSTDRAPYQKDIMNAISDNDTKNIVVMSSAQVGKTEIVLNALGYFIDYDPSPILVMQPTLTMAQTFSKDRLAPMIRDTKVLRGKIKSPRSKDSENTILHKKFPGGQLTVIGSNSAADMASRPIRVVLFDEVDRYEESAGAEGDPISLASKRTTTFWNYKTIKVSTPSIKGKSKIETAYEDSTMEQWKLPCPSCGKYNTLQFERLHFEDLTMECDFCKERFKEQEWKEDQEIHGKWFARKEHVDTRGFHLNEMASPWVSWEEIIKSYRKAKKNTQTYKVWVNTSKGESWEEQGDSADEEDLFARRERYNADLPEGVLLLTAGVDVQDDRIEIEVVGWGRDFESWGIQYKQFFGDPRKSNVWQELDEYLKRSFFFKSGFSLNIGCVCVDSGYLASFVYKFTRPREIRKVFAVKGKGGAGLPILSGLSKDKIEQAKLFTLGVDEGKEFILESLKPNEDGSTLSHFPSNPDRGYSLSYFKTLTSEKRQIKFKNNKTSYEWVKKRERNEGLDLRNYAYAAYHIFNPNMDLLEKYINKGINYLKKPQAKIKKKTGVISKGESLDI